MSLDKRTAEKLTSDGDNDAKIVEAKNPKKVRWSSLKRLLALSKPETGRIIIGLLALLVNGVTNLSFPAILGQAVDKANDADYIKQLGNTGIIFAVGSIASWLRIYCLGTSTERISCRLRKLLFNCYMDKDIEFFDQQRDGELSTILEKDVPLAAETLTDKLAAGLRSLNSSINGSIMLFNTSPDLCGVTLTIVPLVGIAAMTLRKFTKRLQERSRELQGTVLTFALERYRRIATVRLNGQQEKEKESYGDYVDESCALADSAFMAQGSFMSFLNMMTNVSLIAVLYCGGKLIAKKKLTAGVLTKFAIQSVFVGLGFSGLTTFYGDMNKGLDAASRVFSILDEDIDDEAKGNGKQVKQDGDDLIEITENSPSRLSNASDSISTPCDTSSTLSSNSTGSPYSPERVGSLDGKDAVTISGLSFSYPTRPDVQVLHNINLKIKKHSFVAIAGASGSGKSTLMSLICGLYKVRNSLSNENMQKTRQASIQVYGREVITHSPDDADNVKIWLQSSVAVVQQDIGLLSGTIEENILYGKGLRKQVSTQDVHEAAQSANAHQFILECESGYQTKIGDNGSGLSGGQKARIALARALIKKSPILLLDEVTASLDTSNEAEIISLLKRISSSRTVIVFTHSRALMEACDIVHILHEGKLQCSDKYDDLIKGQHAGLIQTVITSKED